MPGEVQWLPVAVEQGLLCTAQPRGNNWGSLSTAVCTCKKPIISTLWFTRAGPRPCKALEQEGRDSPGWFSAWDQPRQRRRVLRKAWDFPKAGAAESPGDLEEMPDRVRVRYKIKTGIGKCPRAQAPPGKLLWGLHMFITLHMNQQKSPGKCSQIQLPTHPVSDTIPAPP